jgi:hypothetical protein
MVQLLAAALLGACGAWEHPGGAPADADVLAALPAPESPRTDVEVVKRLLPARGGRHAGRQWECIVYYTERLEAGAGAVPRRRVEVVYLDAGGRK